MPPETNAAVPAGTRIGPYEVLAPLGSGGMGEVYRGNDTKLHRPVAIKFLSDALADPAARHRFQLEAQTASSLNHPHILTVYDAGDLDSRAYLVTEFIDGGTLGDWTRAAVRTWRQTIDLLTGVADGLAAAHAAGILHRDLKPANILVSRDGYAKLADFGLAKALREASDEVPTLIAPPTRAGMVVGTIAYMSPEQAAGKPLDARSDIFSFGIVLYEALTRRRPFSGATDLELLQTIQHRPPQPLPEDLPIGLRMIVEKALESDPADRYQTMRELVVDLRRLSRRPTAEATVIPASPRRVSGRWAIAWGALALVAAAAVGGGVWSWTRNGPAAPANPLTDARFTRFTNFEGTERSAAISPDGKFVAFRSDREGPFDVWLGQVGAGGFVNVTHGIDDEYATDTASVGFTADGSEVWLSGGPDSSRRLRLLPLMGGSPRAFLPDRAVNVAWSPDGSRIVYHTWDDGDPIFVADRTGANAKEILRRKAGDHDHFPVWSRDGRWIYFASGTPAIKEMDVWRIAAEGGAPERLTRLSSDVAYPTPIDSHTLLYVAHDQDGSGPWLWALDLDRRVPRRISVGLEKYLSIGGTADGRRLVATVANPGASLWSVPIVADRVAEESDVKPFTVPTPDASAPRFGPTALFLLSSSTAGAGLSRVENGQAVEIWKGADGPLLAPPGVSADGQRIAIVLRQNGKLRLHVLSADGAQIESVAGSLDVRGGASWSPDGAWIVAGGNDGTGPGLFKIARSGGGPTRIAAGPAFDPVWSPDGNLIVYAGTNSSNSAPLLAVRPDGAHVELPPIRVRREGERARFAPGGKVLIYMQGILRSQDFWLLDLATMKTRPVTRLSARDAMRTFDIAPDGARIVFDRLRENADIVVIDRAKE